VTIPVDARESFVPDERFILIGLKQSVGLLTGNPQQGDYMRKFILSIVLVLASSSAYATLTPFTPVAGINPAAGFVRLTITHGSSTVTLTSASGLTCSGTIPRNCNISFPTAGCLLPTTGTANCRQVGDFDIFPKATTQVAVVLDGSTHSVRLQNLMVIRRRGASTVNDIKFEASGNIAKDVNSAGVAHGFKLVGTFYRTVKTSGSPIAAAAIPVSTLGLVASKAVVTGSYVYVKNSCNTNPVSATTTCQGGRTNYNSGTHTVTGTTFTSTSANSIKLGSPILIVDNGTPSATKCADAFSTGTTCLNIDHSRLAVTFTLSKPTTITTSNSTLATATGCTTNNDPCNTLDRVEITASGAGYSGETEEIVFLGTGLLAEPHQSGNPGDSGKIMFKVFGTDAIDTNKCECLNPAATLSPGLNGPAEAVQQCTYDQDFNNDGKPDLFVKFDQNELGFKCEDAPIATVVLSMFCRDVQITAVETTSGKGKEIITTEINELIDGFLTNEGQLPITPCQ
jgi:hypothetical protein